MPVSVPTQAEFDALAGRVARLEGTAPPGPTPGQPAATGHYITKPSDPAIIDDAMNVWTLVASGGQQIAVQRAGTQPPPMIDAVTANVTRLGMDLVAGKRQIVQQNAAGAFYTTTAPFAPWAPIAGPDGPPPAPGSIYTVHNGRIYTPNGSEYVATCGVNVLDNGMHNTPPSLIRTKFPKCRFIRLAIGADGSGYTTAQPDAAIQAWASAATALGMVVEIESHHGGASQASVDQQELAWYARLARLFAGNPMVWFGSQNEVIGDISGSHKAIHDAIRGTGSRAILMCCTNSGNCFYQGGQPNNAGVYGGMSNIVWDMHWYNWMTNGEADQIKANAALASNIRGLQGWVQSADGVIPVIVGETGFLDYIGQSGETEVNGTKGTNQIINSALTTGCTVGSGCGLWLWNVAPYNWPTTATDLVDRNTGALTQHGTYVNQVVGA